MLSSLGLKLGDRVLLDDMKPRSNPNTGDGISSTIPPRQVARDSAVLVGPLSLRAGSGWRWSWTAPRRKNDGSVGGVRYFNLPPQARYQYYCNTSTNITTSSAPKLDLRAVEQPPPAVISAPRTPRLDLASRLASKTKKEKKKEKEREREREKEREKALKKKLSEELLDPEGLNVELGDQVLVAGQKIGTVRFYGKTDFAPGYWFGVELEMQTGKHDGSVFGVRYFTCLPKYGVFAPPSRVQRIGGPKEGFQNDNSAVKKVHQVSMLNPNGTSTRCGLRKTFTSRIHLAERLTVPSVAQTLEDKSRLQERDVLELTVPARCAGDVA
ncbi:unnamed protein product [Gadus morhua 'NCC']